MSRYSSSLIDGWLDGYWAAIRGSADCATRPPLDLPRWWQLMLERRPPSWSSPHQIAFQTPLAKLRDFSTARPRGLVPTLVLPPQAGHDSCIVDFSAQQSQIRVILGAGLERALALDWAGATAETADASIEDYLEVVDRAVEHCGGRVNMVGDCQGGWLAATYSARQPERVNTLTIAGAPIDFHAGEPVIGELVGHLAPRGDMTFFEALVASGGGVLKGENMLGGFVLINPADEIARQLELLLQLDDPAYVDRYRPFEDWFKHTQDIPGAFYLWVVRNLFIDNLLIEGGLEIGGHPVDLAALQMPLNLLAGESDHITPPDQVFALADAASTGSEHIRQDVAPGGHLGLFMGHRALREHWPPLLQEVLKHSAPSHAAPHPTLQP